MFKNILFQIHWFLGITAGLILSIVGVTGAIYSYEPQILKWINKDSYVVQAENRDKLTPEQLYTHFTQQQPTIKINSITISKDPTASSIVNIEKAGERKGYNMMVNPYSAEILPEIKGKGFFAGVQSLHRWLTVGKIGDREVGKQIVAASTLMLIFFVLSGLFLRWPRKHSFRQWFMVKPHLNGRNFLWDLHAVVGTWVAIFYLVLACTGLYWSYDWWRNGMFKVLGVEQKAPSPKNQPHPQQAQPSTTDITTILNTTWTNATAQIGRDYSTLTLNIPKTIDGKIEFSYVDPIPQHERARNNVVFNYQENTIIKHDIYETKPLNEKIMSSMLPVHRGSFFGSVYQFFVMLAALTMPLFFITGWLLYIKRREQKIRTEEAKKQASLQPVISATTQNGQDWLIVYATQSGTAEQLAWQTATSLQKAGQAASVMAVQNLTEEMLLQQKRILMIASTFGTGESPDLAVNFSQTLMNQVLDLSHLQFAVLALGSKEYADTYCLFGHEVATWFKRCGAIALFDTIEVNNVDPNDIQRWNNALTQVSNVTLDTIQLHKTFNTWSLDQRDILNPDTTGAFAFNIELTNQDQLTWQAGDIAEIQTGNSEERIQRFLAQLQIDENELTRDNIPLSLALLHKDLTGEIPNYGDVEHLLELLPNLPTREYSIANIPQPDQSKQRLRLVVRQHYDQQGELGLGSGWLTVHRQLHDPIEVHIRSNPSFHLIDDDRPIICIGNGTGIAGLMSLLHARAARHHHKNWLIFGERKKAHDFFYQTQLEVWKMAGVLTRLDVAFSRDQAEKVYVQHILQQHADELKTWITQGAVIYVCGSIDGMASGVDAVLVDILGADEVNQLRQAGRYRRDVY